MNETLSDRLRRLGVSKGPAAIREPTERRPAQLVENLIPGRLVSDGDRSCFLTEERFVAKYRHGVNPVAGLLDCSIESAAQVGQEPALSGLSFRDLLFIDTETTGLSGGAGTLAFMVGIGFFDGDDFIVQQYFLRSPGDEPAMLSAMADLFSNHAGLVTFNGRSFDMPLLESRYLLNRQRPPFLGFPHLDLLHPSRRLWRNVLDSCRLVALESDVMNITRDQADVPSGIIPLIYRDYLQTGNGLEMQRIFYHNQIDILSLVTLTERLLRIYSTPAGESLLGLEWLALARWYEQAQQIEAAETAYRQAIQSDLSQEAFMQALFRLGWLLKRAGRFEEAATLWQQLAVVEMDEIQGHVELAKYHEWRTGDLQQAVEWTQRALALVSHWPRGLQKLTLPDLEHRQARLKRKLAGASSDEHC